ncbi:MULTISPECIES: hypothetical protein [Streptomyces]|uniref:Uncharacterized protein n=2 Tax=Streptomyces TaxID=1883 RepID=A0A0W7WS43_9ACTN|nr:MULTISPECIES: hypothetical protein [Streptomyces]KUF13402.1 hypothetical protein AT728_33730 [Streptomyces silvensis]MVO86489.1 hypothetical protein [Streptomyces typhae]
MSKPDELLVNISAKVESENTNQMSLTVVVAGAVVTGRLAPERVWRERVSEVLKDSARLGPFADVFGESRGGGPPDDTAGAPREDGEADAPRQDGEGGAAPARPTHLHFHLARILQGNVGIPETGGMYRVAIADVSAWTVGDFSYSDQ